MTPGGRRFLGTSTHITTVIFVKTGKFILDSMLHRKNLAFWNGLMHKFSKIGCVVRPPAAGLTMAAWNIKRQHILFHVSIR